MVRQTGRARAVAAIVLASGLLYAQCGGSKTTQPTPVVPTPTPIDPTQPPIGTSVPQIFVGAGDIGWNQSNGGQELTAKLIESIGGTVFTAGDNAYLEGTAQNYADYYDRSWGRVGIRSRTRPVPGNHEYDNHPDMAGYFGYFGTAFAGPPPGYYSFPVGDWHIIMLNSSIADKPAGAAQEAWLQNDLSLPANVTKCTLAVFHFPLFTSGQNGPVTSVRRLWQILYDKNVDVIVNGHEHLYEVFFPQSPDGLRDNARGIREFIVGTGGAALYQFVTTAPNSQRKISGTYGVLKFTLGVGYDWQFVPVPGGQSDQGSGSCH
jgi:hypothetical protein